MPLVESYRSLTATACEHRAFVLRAVGIPSEVIHYDNAFVLFVDAMNAHAAHDHLERYEVENAPISVSLASTLSPPMHEYAWVAPALYTFALLLAAFLAGRNFFGFDWYGVGALSSSIQVSHEWWRAITALMLHADHQHLLSNVGFGALFSFAAARLLGSGVAFASMLVAAVLGNIIDSALMPSTHASIGASTMAFAALGLISAYSWRLQLSKRMKWTHRSVPLVAGVMLLGFLGASGANTDVLAHLAGFFFGATFGVLLARTPLRFFDNAAIQYGSAIAASALLIGAWLCAFAYGGVG